MVGARSNTTNLQNKMLWHVNSMCYTDAVFNFSRKPSVDDVGNPSSVNARWVQIQITSFHTYIRVQCERHLLRRCHVYVRSYKLFARKHANRSIPLHNLFFLQIVLSRRHTVWINFSNFSVRTWILIMIWTVWFARWLMHIVVVKTNHLN